MTIFNIHFFTQVQTKVEGDYLGRVLSTIFTLAILFMPIAKGLMTWLPSVRVESFLLIGAGVILFSLLAQVVAKKLQAKRQVHQHEKSTDRCFFSCYSFSSVLISFFSSSSCF